MGIAKPKCLFGIVVKLNFKFIFFQLNLFENVKINACKFTLLTIIS